MAYEEIKVSDGGEIAGKVIYKGTIPMRKVVPTKDREVCGDVREDPQIIVGKEGGVKFAVAYLKDIKKGRAWMKSDKLPVIDNHNCRFEPHVQAIRAGTKITIHNSDPVLHNTHSFSENKTVFNVALPFQDASVDRPVRRPGVIRVECDAHGWMLGWLYAVENPYYDVSGEDGTFSIKDIPPGEYKLLVWQEYTGTTERLVTVKKGQTTNVEIELEK